MLQIWLLFHLFYVASLQSCDNVDLYGDYTSKTRTKIPIFADNKFKCIQMYDKVVPFNITAETMANVSRYIEVLETIIKQATVNPSVMFEDVREILARYSCLPSYFGTFIDQLEKSMDRHDPRSRDEKKTLSLTCPLGLLYDISCSYMSCFNSDKCRIDGKTCSVQGGSMCNKPPLTLHHYCKDDLMNFLRSCTTDLELINYMEKLHGLKNTECQKLNTIYQGLPSFKVDKESTIAAHCVRDDGNVTLKCFRNGIPLNNVTWLADGQEVSLHHDNMTYPRASLAEIKLFVCKDEGQGQVVAEMTGEALHKLCKLVNDEHYTDDTTGPTLESTSSSTPASSSIWSRRMAFYHENIWATITHISQLNMLNNNATLREYVGRLSIAISSFMGQGTAICGDGWNEAAGEVFCRDAGAQLGETWTADFVGAVPKTSGESRHYLRNLKCSGNEEKLIWCNHSGWYEHESCQHDAVILCSKVEMVPEVDLVLILSVAGAAVVLIVLVGYCSRKYAALLQELKQRINDYNRRVSDPATIITLPFINGSQAIDPGSQSQQYSSITFSERESCPYSIDISVPAPPMEPIEEEEDVIELIEIIKGKPPELIPKVARVKINGEDYIAKLGQQEHGESESDGLKSEFMFLKVKHHPNIVKLHYTDLKPISGNMYFIMEYLQYGSLDSFLRMKREDDTPTNFSNLGHTLRASEISRLIVGVCRALYFVHKNSYVHGDVKSDNYFVFNRASDTVTDSSNDAEENSHDRYDVKLGDFGSFFKPSAINREGCTFLYNAPEYCVSRDITPIGPQGKAVVRDPYKNEVWSLGYIIWELVSFIGCPDHQLYNTANTLPLASTSVTEEVRLNSRFEFEGSIANNFTCNRRRHIPLLAKFDLREIKVLTKEPDQHLMAQYWEGYDKNPGRFGYPVMSPAIDQIMGWEVCGLIKKCLSVFPDDRPTMEDIMKSLIERFEKAPEKAPEDCAQKDLFDEFIYTITGDLCPLDDDPLLNIEDVSSAGSTSSATELLTAMPEQLQGNLGQLA